MAARRKSLSVTNKTPSQISSEEPPPAAETAKEEIPFVASPKLGLILPAAAFFYLPFSYLVFSHYQIDPELKRSIAINAAISLVGFVLAVRIIPVAARCLLRRNSAWTSTRRELHRVLSKYFR